MDDTDLIYLKCNECGEVFDTIATAYNHGLAEAFEGNIIDWTILMEDEAF